MRARILACSAIMVLLTIGTACLHWYATRPVHEINFETAKQINEGMTLEEIVAIFHVPAGDYSTRGGAEVQLDCMFEVPKRYEHSKKWRSDSACVWVYFNRNERVESVRCMGIVYLDIECEWDTWPEKIRCWLHIP